MTAKIDPKGAVATLVQASIELDRCMERTPISGLFLRTFSPNESMFVPKMQHGWFSRGLERFQWVGSKHAPYSLETNLAHFHELTEVVVKHPLPGNIDGFSPELKTRFESSVPVALNTLLVCLEKLVEESKKAKCQVQIAKTRALFDRHLGGLIEARKAVQELVRGFLQDPHYSIFSSKLVRELFEQYQQILEEITKHIGEGIASKEEEEVLRSRLKRDLLEALQKKLHMLFDLFKKEAIAKIQSAKKIEDFHRLKISIQEQLQELIAIDTMLPRELQSLLSQEISTVAELLIDEEMPRYSELVTEEVLPQIRHFFEAIDKKTHAELKQLLDIVNKYINFLRQVADKLRCPKNASSCPQSRLLDQAIALLESGRETIHKKMPEAISQVVSGSGNQIINAHTVTIIHGKNGTEECLLDEVSTGIIPTSKLEVLRYGATVLFSAATTYATSNLSLAWSLVAGATFTAAPAIAKTAARQMVPGAFVSAVDPVIDFSARLLIWHYGTSTIQMLAGQARETAPAAPPTAVQQFVNSSAIPTVVGAIDLAKVVRKPKKSEPTPAAASSSTDGIGLMTRSIAYLSALFWMNQKRRATQVL